MFFLPIGNLPVETREKYVNHLVEMNRKAKENEEKNKEIKMLKKIMNNPPTSLSIKSMIIYSYAVRRLKELEQN